MKKILVRWQISLKAPQYLRRPPAELEKVDATGWFWTEDPKAAHGFPSRRHAMFALAQARRDLGKQGWLEKKIKVVRRGRKKEVILREKIVHAALALVLQAELAANREERGEKRGDARVIASFEKLGKACAALLRHHRDQHQAKIAKPAASPNH